jgi:hypothetical protein
VPTVSVSRILDAPAEAIWPAVRTPHAFVHVARGMVRFPAAERIDRPWEVGDHVSGWTLLFGLLPFSKHRLMVESIDDDRRTIVSDERGGPIRTWRHEIVVTPIDDHQCHYEDRIQIDAGVLTAVVVAYAKVFYRYRQRRWRSLASLLAATATSADQVSIARHAGVPDAPHT